MASVSHTSLSSAAQTADRQSLTLSRKQCHIKGRSKGIAKAHTLNELSIAKILTQDCGHPRELGGGPDEAVPIGQLMLSHTPDGFDNGTGCHFIDQPGTHVVGDAAFCLFERQWWFNLAGHRDQELTEHLGTERPTLPGSELVDDGNGPGLLSGIRTVIGIDEHIRVNEKGPGPGRHTAPLVSRYASGARPDWALPGAPAAATPAPLPTLP